MPGIRLVGAQAVPYAAAWHSANTAALSADGPLWVALGDSLTQGIGASAFDRGWVGQLQDRLARRGQRFRVVNLGSSGARIQDVLTDQLPVLGTLQPQLVTLMIGSNDLLRPSLRRSIAAHMTELLAAVPTGTVVTTLPNPGRPGQAANEVISRLATERRLIVAELRDPRLRSWRGRLAADHFHPNDAGYAMLAEVIADAVARSANQR